MTPDEIAKGLDDKDEFNKFQVQVICGWCKKPLGFKPTNRADQHGKISHGICTDCERKQYEAAGLPYPGPVTESLDDVDEFEDTGIYCDNCEAMVQEGDLFPIDPYEPQWSRKVCQNCLDILNQGPPNDKWLEFRESVLDDKDGFADNSRCERCNSTDWVEPVHFNDTMEHLCRWCKKQLYVSEDIGLDDVDEFHTPAPSCDFCGRDNNVQFVTVDLGHKEGHRVNWLCGPCRTSPFVRIVKENLDDSDEFGHPKVQSAYEETGSDSAKMLFFFEDGYKAYYYCTGFSPEPDGSPSKIRVQSKMILVSPTGEISIHNFGSLINDELPGIFATYYDGMSNFDSNQRRPFPQNLENEWEQTMGMESSEGLDIPDEIAEGLEGLEDKDEFGPQIIQPANVVGYAYKGQHQESCAMTYEFVDGAKVFYSVGELDDVQRREELSGSDMWSSTKMVLQDASGVSVVPEFRSSTDAPSWFAPYYNGMVVAGVNLPKTGGVAMWRRGRLLPFSNAQSREWTQMIGRPPIAEAAIHTGPTVATLLNRWAIKPDPANLNKQQPTGPSDALDDVDVFANNRTCSDYNAKDIVMRDQHGNNVAEKLKEAFQDKMGTWITYSPGWLEHHNFEDFDGHLSTRPPLLGPECVVWVDAPMPARGGGEYYAAAWYHPEKGVWIDE